MLEQIEIMENAIKSTLSKNVRLDYNYSIHTIVAEIKMFIGENQDDELIQYRWCSYRRNYIQKRK